VRRADSSARTNARSTRAASFGFLFKFWATVLRFMIAVPSVTQTRLRESDYEVPPLKALNKQPIDFLILPSCGARVSATVLK
jgi:hypothetical protein